MSFASRLDAIRDKPHHVRRQVAFASAVGVTAVIALVWLSVSLYVGAFEIQGSNFAELTGAASATGADTGAGSGSDAVAGAAAAGDPTSGAPALDVVGNADDGGAASGAQGQDQAPQAPAESPSAGSGSAQNIIPF